MKLILTEKELRIERELLVDPERDGFRNYSLYRLKERAQRGGRR